MDTAVNSLVNYARYSREQINPATNRPQGLVKRLVAPRVAMPVISLCDVGQVAKNIIHGAIQVPGIGVKWFVKPFRMISGSEALKRFENRFPGVPDLLQTVAKTVAYALGAISTLIGVLFPRAAISFHDAMGLSRDNRAKALLAEIKSLENTEATLAQQTLTTLPVDVEPAADVAAIKNEETATIIETTTTVVTQEEEVVSPSVTSEISEITSDYEIIETAVTAPAKSIKDYAWSVPQTAVEGFDWLKSTRVFKTLTLNAV